ncbi:MAG TPA: hypothetical protein PLN21_18735 [Gemmatales bacterium]|nr:hypothetical protein [Gemmatales bacterium]
MDTNPAPTQPVVPAAPVTPVLPIHTRFDASPYVPDGGFSVVGLLMLFVGLAIAGIIMGVITHYVSRFIYFILVFPMLIGFAVGGVGALLVKWGKVRSPWVAGGAGLLAGILAMLTVHYLDYRQFIEEREGLMANIPIMKNAGKKGRELWVNLNAPPGAERDLLKRHLAVESFFDYIDFAAHEGVTIKHGAGNNNGGANLGYYGTYIYWLVETLIVAGIVFGMTRKPAQEPFCNLTNEWKTAKCGDNFLVPIEVGSATAATALKEGDLGKLAEIKAQGANSTGQTEPVRLYVLASPNHFDQCTLEAKLVKFVAGKNGQLEEKELAVATYPASALPAFETFCG